MKAMIAMSGGVDSSVAAALTRQNGYECIGATMRLYSGEQSHIDSDIADARAASERLGMPHYVLEAGGLFEHEVIENFVRTYERGQTPNPCIFCNRRLKFDYFYEQALALGCEKIVTGHYARIEQRADGRWLLKKGLDSGKDQSYVLYMLSQQTLSHTLLPLGGMDKAQVRAMAEKLAFVNAHKHDSQDICFIPDGDYGAFIRRYTGKDYPTGDFTDESGKVLGRHHGIIDYTIGQRRGLGVAAGHPVYVCRKCMDTNTVVLSDNDRLFSSVLHADGVNLIDRDEITQPIRCKAKVRYRHTEQPCTVTQTDTDRIRVEFDEPQRAVTAGQAVVLYDEDIVIGGGTILPTA